MSFKILGVDVPSLDPLIYTIVGAFDPQITPTFGAPGAIFYQTGPGAPRVLQKQDGGISTNWTPIGGGSGSSNFLFGPGGSANYIPNPNAEADLAFWTPYNNSGNLAPAYLQNQDLLFTSTTPGAGGNGIQLDYVFNAGFPAATPNINVISPTHVQVQWNNGPTIANNPTPAQIMAAWNAVPAAVAIASVANPGGSTALQYIVGTMFFGNGGDVSPSTGTGGIPAGLTLSRTLVNPLRGVASYDLGKAAVNAQGQGVSTDFTIDAQDAGKQLPIALDTSLLGAFVSGDLTYWIFDKTNAVLIPVMNSNLVGSPYFLGKFQSAANSTSYRFIIHVASVSALAYDLVFDTVSVSPPAGSNEGSTLPEQLVLKKQPISGAVTDHMAVVWNDGASAWIPAVSNYTDYWGMYGFAINLIPGNLADVQIRGKLDSFPLGSFPGAFHGFNLYVDAANPGKLTPGFPPTANYVIMGKAISTTEINIQPYLGFVNIPAKGGLLTSANGLSDTVLAVGANGNALIANSAAANGINWAPAVVAAAPFTYTLATRTLTIADATDAVRGAMSAADHTTLTGAAPKASPTFTGDVNSSTGNVLISTLGKGLQVKTGTNSKIGTAVLAAGTVTVANTSVTANSRIFLTSQSDGGTPGFLRVTAKTVGTSFVITSSNAADTSTVAWMIVESIP